MARIQTPPATIWTMYNATSRKHEPVGRPNADGVPGQTAIRLFWSQSMGRYVTIPGASLYTVQTDGTLTLQTD